MSSLPTTTTEPTTITVHSCTSTTHHSSPSSSASNLPALLHTPLGMALIEIQGTINHPPLPETPTTTNTDDNSDSQLPSPPRSLTIGRLVFPDLTSDGPNGVAQAGASEGPWMKRAWLYVGEHQRLTGEVKNLAKPLGVLRRRSGGGPGEGEMDVDGAQDELEIADVIRWKVVFSSRPEPVGVV